jgi:hypothetical protein
MCILFHQREISFFLHVKVLDHVDISTIRFRTTSMTFKVIFLYKNQKHEAPGTEMKDQNVICTNCDESFEILLPDDTTRTGYDECEEIHKYHNLKHPTRCLNCDQINTIYYCTDGHQTIQ